MPDWRLLIDQPRDGWENMAIDEALLSGCNHGFSQPTIRLYEWSSPTLSIGCFQKSEELSACCLRNGIPFVRRISGGRGVLHGNEITYAVICGEDEWLFREGVSSAYKAISRCFLETLKEAGVNAEMHASFTDSQKPQKNSCFHSPSKYEIIINGKKLIGSAQKRLKSSFLQHGSIVFDIDKRLVLEFFGEDSLSRMGWIGLHCNIKKEEFKAILIDKMIKGLNIKLTEGSMNSREIYLKDKLVQLKYKSEEWNIWGAADYNAAYCQF